MLFWLLQQQKMDAFIFRLQKDAADDGSYQSRFTHNEISRAYVSIHITQYSVDIHGSH